MSTINGWHYFDFNATTPVIPAVVKAMLPYFARDFGNPSSQHWLGRQARLALSSSRESVADILQIRAAEVVFCGSGSEANNLAIKGAARALQSKGRHLVCSATEHHSVLNSMRELENDGFEVSYLPVKSSGELRCDLLAKALRANTTLVSIMAANNETGAIQPMEEIGRIIKQHGALFHTDAVQALGKTALDLTGWGVDLASFSGHKIFAPKGIGMLYVKDGIELWPLISGGGQENKMRSGTENIPYIVGYATALRSVYDNLEQRCENQRILRDYFEDYLLQQVPDLIINAVEMPRVCNTSNIIFPGIEGRKLVLFLSERGYYVASGAACSSRRTEPSHVLLAMGRGSELSLGSIRVSLGLQSSREQVESLAEAMINCLQEIKNDSAG